MNSARLIERFENSFDIQRHASPSVLNNTKLLLKLYRKVEWRLENSLDDMEEECFEIGNKHLYETLDELAGLTCEIDTQRLESHLTSLLRSRSLMNLINKALVMLKSYPDNGEIYFSIIQKQYLAYFKLGEDEMLEELNICRSNFYKLKRQAIETLGVILWGFLIPEVRERCKQSIA